jgi:hypothetical protein
MIERGIHLLLRDAVGSYKRRSIRGGESCARAIVAWTRRWSGFSAWKLVSNCDNENHNNGATRRQYSGFTVLPQRM